MKKILDRWWIFVCGGIVIFMFGLFIMHDLNIQFDRKYMKKIGENVHPLIENIKIHADGNEYEVVIIDGYFKNRHFDNEPFNLKTRMFRGRVDINYYIMKKGCTPLSEDYKLWSLIATIPVKRDSLFNDYHIDGKLVNELPWYNYVFASLIDEFMDEYINNKDIEYIKELRREDIEREEYKYENTIIFNNNGELKEEGEVFKSYITSSTKGKMKVTAKLVINSALGEKDLYITTEKI
ncbi:hypothetical protein [Oceanirhabdus sp. W0125-5]|uniref:hypothetical protein n=1 Tax=Oceanirhabdus sp. W0125-5 TaxID=2999116 RepID=UPI0022F312D7|nr:hypothetical protein [Oceanirhabdus sp. W0125-5]WBW96500.1 hypothetical protein OW730_22810 [Oceanirhabdus sp. W0125-5]